MPRRDILAKSQILVRISGVIFGELNYASMVLQGLTVIVDKNFERKIDRVIRTVSKGLRSSWLVG